MSFFICDACGKRHNIFSSGGGMRSSEELGIPFLGEVPLDGRIVEGGDEGVPLVEAEPRSVAANVSAVAMREDLTQADLVQISRARAEKSEKEQSAPSR